jgi:hypothetical protein
MGTARGTPQRFGERRDKDSDLCVLHISAVQDRLSGSRWRRRGNDTLFHNQAALSSDALPNNFHSAASGGMNGNSRGTPQRFGERRDKHSDLCVLQISAVQDRLSGSRWRRRGNDSLLHNLAALSSGALRQTERPQAALLLRSVFHQSRASIRLTHPSGSLH